MPVATLLTDPATPRLDRALVESLRNAWGGGDAVWLSPDVAAEFPLAEIPSNRWDVWQDLQAQGIDLIVQPAENRRKRMLLADMDSTMIGQECIDELADAAGVGDRVKEITARAMNGELGFEGALTERVRLLKACPKASSPRFWPPASPPRPAARCLLATMRAHGAYAALVSGGFTAFTARIAADLGFDEHRANTLLAENGRLTGDVARPSSGARPRCRRCARSPRGWASPPPT